MVRDVSKYYIGETGGFPFSRQTARVGRMDCVIPVSYTHLDVYKRQEVVRNVILRKIRNSAADAGQNRVFQRLGLLVDFLQHRCG